MSAGVYSIVNRVNGKRYVGHSKNIRDRLNEHFNALKKSKHGNVILQKAWDKYGADNFTSEVLEYCGLNEMVEREQYWMNFYKSYCKESGYNVAPAAASNLGWKMPSTTKEKISKAMKGRKGHPLTEQQKDHYRRLYTGKKLPADQKAAISIGLRRYYESGGEASLGMLGKHHTTETRKAIANSNRGKKRSEITRKRISEGHRGVRYNWKNPELRIKRIADANRGKQRSAETKLRLSIAWDYDKHFTQETRKKISESMRKSLARRKAQGGLHV